MNEKVMQILMIEDDPVLGKALSQGLEEAGHRCLWIQRGDEGLKEALSWKADVIILDLMLPELPGLSLLCQIRSAGIQTPVLILSARATVEERVKGLQYGADDYLVKPFAFPELMARLIAITRRSIKLNSTQLMVGDLKLDLTSRRVFRGEREIELTPTEFSLLEYLMREAGQVVTRRMLCEHLWDADWEGVTNVIEVHINRLRGKVDKGFESSLIQTVRGQGYAIRSL